MKKIFDVMEAVREKGCVVLMILFLLVLMIANSKAAENTENKTATTIDLKKETFAVAVRCVNINCDTKEIYAPLDCMNKMTTYICPVCGTSYQAVIGPSSLVSVDNKDFKSHIAIIKIKPKQCNKNKLARK